MLRWARSLVVTMPNFPGDRSEIYFSERTGTAWNTHDYKNRMPILPKLIWLP
jgi:hypothetical protein